MYSRKSVGPKMDPWRTPFIHNHEKWSITEKRRNKVNNRPEKPLDLNLPEIRMPHPVEKLGYIKCYSSSSPRPIKCHSNCFRRTAVDWEDLKPHWKSEKDHISRGDQQAYYLKVQTFY